MSPESPRTVADIMTADPQTISPRDTLEFVEEGMERFRFRHLPVEEDGRLHAVSEAMTREVKTVQPDTPLAEAAALLVEQKIGCLPVLDAQNQLVGIVTESDFVALSARLL